MTEDNRYEILQELGRGAMGIVYKAMDRETGECVALKVLKPEVIGDALLMERFKNELRIARKITHRNVCRIYEFTHIDKGPCISMEYVDGETIRSLLSRLGALSLRTALDIARQICSGLREAHAQGVVHRDLKPENLMMDRNGTLKVMDFGVARIFSDGSPTTIGAFVGTPAYMAPEQVEGRNIDQRADIYALGLIVYEMLTGNSAFAGDTPMAVAYKQVHEAPPAPRSIDPTIPENVQALILRCIEKEPERRFREIRELEAVLAELGHRSPTTHIHPRPEVPRRNTTTFIMARRKARLLMAAVQILYLSIYAAALYYDDSVGRILETVFEINATIGVRVVYVLAMCGIAARVYISSALAWDHPDLPVQFRRLFPLLWLLDSIWAASPLLLLDKLRFGMILGCIALLAYVPFSQRTLMENLSTDNPLRPL
jgi:serine/threonine protein kinase